MLALLRHPAEPAALAAEPSLVAQAVEEVLRYDPPVQLCAGLTTCWLEQAAVPVR